LPAVSFDSVKYYSRQVALRDLGEHGQRKLREARVVVVGVGGIGSVSALYLALAGVGELILVDQDTVEIHNLHRQILFTAQDLRLPKAEVAARRLMEANPDVKALPVADNLRTENAERIIERADVVVDGLDNMRTRYALNSACSKLGVPYVFGGAIAMEGNVSVFHPPETPCLECVLPSIDDARLPGCDTRGVLGATAGIIGSIQAMETIKLLAGIGETLKGKLLICDFRRMEFDKIQIFRRENCDVCSGEARGKPEDTHRLTWLCGRETINVNPVEPLDLDMDRIAEELGKKFETLAHSDIVVVFRYANYEVSLFRNGRTLIKGATTEQEALKVYRELFGFLQGLLR